jgi:hypothetical protein
VPRSLTETPYHTVALFLPALSADSRCPIAPFLARPMAKRQRIPKDQPAPAEHGGDSAAMTPIDPRLVIIARAIGRLIAREQLDSAKARSDN